MTKKKSENKDASVIVATEEKKIKFGGSATGNAITEEDETEEEETEEDEEEDEEDDDDSDDSDNSDSDDSDDEEDEEEIISKMKKSPIKESTDHIIGIVSTGKLHLLEDGIMGVIKSKLREKIDEQKDQIKAKLIFKGE